MAVNEAHKILSETAYLLDAVLYDSKEEQPPRRGGPQRFLFIIEPPDLRLWQAGDDINMVCLSDNKAQTFWAYVAEKTGDEDLAARTPAWAHDPQAANDFSGVDIAKLPLGSKLRLQYAPIPAHFDIALVGAYGLPDYPSDGFVNIRLQLRLETIQEAINARSQISDGFVRSYHGLRNWAKNAGLLSKNFGPLNSPCLLRLVLQLKDGEDLEHDFFITYSDVTNLNSAERNGKLPQGLNKRRIALAAQQTREDWSLYSAAIGENAARFCRSFETYIQVKCRYWASTAGALSRLIEVTTNLQYYLGRNAVLELRLWPMTFDGGQATAQATDDKAFILLFGVISSEDDLAVVLRSHSQNEWSWLEPRVNSEIEITVETQQAIQGYQPSFIEEHQAPQTSRPSVADTGTDKTTLKLKLRPAGQILARLRWHPAHQSQHYEVGYLDRFDGLKWLPLQNCGRAIEDEDFIPEHRITQYRRVEDGQIVWDRAKRIDLTGQV